MIRITTEIGFKWYRLSEEEKYEVWSEAYENNTIPAHLDYSKFCDIMDRHAW